jgi:hypothetical protein
MDLDKIEDFLVEAGELEKALFYKRLRVAREQDNCVREILI